MKTVGKHEFISIDQVELDINNPRIKKFLEMYSGEPTAEQLFMALGADGDEKETETAPTFNKLKQSIITNGGIIQPIIVNRSTDGRNVCIDGNTRLALYRSFRDEGIEGARTLMIGAGLAGVYTFLYITLRQQDYALLMGAIALFIVLAIVMYVTRKVDWYARDAG